MEYQSSIIPDKIKENLKFCSICKNKKNDIKYNSICGLTNNVKEFDNFCADFKYNLKN